jgi:hypothetical protein
MAYYLNNASTSNARVDLTSTIFIGVNVGDYIEFEVEANSGNVSDAYRLASGEQLNFRAILEVGPSQVFFRPDNNSSISFTSNYTQPPVGQKFTVKVERVSSGVWECFIDGASVGTGASAENFKIIQFGDFRIFNNSAFQGKFYRVTASTDGGATVTNNWNKQTLSGSNDTVFPDTAGGNDGTLVNYPADNSQWVFFDDGGGATGVTSDADYTIPAPTFTSTASVTLPVPIADASFTIAKPTFSADAAATLPQPIADASFTVLAPVFAATGAATLPQPAADVSFTVSAPTFAATADATIPGFSASFSFAVSKPSFSGTASVTLPNPIADAAYTVSAPTFSVDADASLPQPSADVAFSVNSPQFAASATATEPGFNASVNFTVNAPTFSGNASATLPQPDADANFTVSAPTFSVVAIVGGIAIIVDDETNITLQSESNNIALDAESNNIDLPALSNNLEI